MPPRRAALVLSLTALLVTAGQTPEEAYQSGLVHLRQGRLPEASATLENVVTQKPKFAPAWFALGVSRAAQRACSLQPKLADACFYHGRALYLVNRFTEAISVLGSLSDDRRRFRLQALCHDALGHWKEAEALYRRAIEEDPGGEDPRIDYAIALARQGRAGESVPLLELSIKSGRQVPRAELELGRIQLQLGRLEQARTHLERAVSLTPSSAQAHLLLGRLYARLGLPEEASRHLDLGAANTQSIDKY
jgi:tetratricopeptide (TPR) repeat protein